MFKRIAIVGSKIGESMKLTLSLANRGLGVMLSDPHPAIDRAGKAFALFLAIYLIALLTGIMPHGR